MGSRDDEYDYLFKGGVVTFQLRNTHMYFVSKKSRIEHTESILCRSILLSKTRNDPYAT